VVTDDGTGQLRLAQRTLRLDPADSTQALRWPRGRPGRSVFSVVRALFALEGGARQAEIAEITHVGQAAVSKALNRLADRDLVVPGEHGWEVTDRAERANPAISGDVAADLVAPWRTPRRATLYAQRGTDFSAIGLTPSDASVATLTLVLADDPDVWPISRLRF
jgi:hypothetical protein